MNYRVNPTATGVGETAMTSQETATPYILPIELQRRVIETVDGLFTTQSTFPSYALEKQLATGIFPPDIEALRKPAAGIDRREGSLIEAAIGHAMATSGKYACRAAFTVEIYREAIGVIDANQGFDVDALAIRLPLLGAATGRVVIDVLAIDPSAGIAHLVEVKRSASGLTEEQLRTLKAAAFTVRDSLLQRGILVTKVAPQRVVWWGTPGGDYVTRDTADEFFGVPIRDVVDAVVREYRMLVSARIRELWGSMSGSKLETVEVPKRPPAIDIGGLTRALATLELPILEKVAAPGTLRRRPRGRPRKAALQA